MVDVKMNDWELSGVLIRLGDLACKYAREQNKDADLYGYASMEATFSWNMFQTVISCIKCFKGFDVYWCMDASHLTHIKKFGLTYDGEDIGFPWEVENEKN